MLTKELYIIAAVWMLLFAALGGALASAVVCFIQRRRNKVSWSKSRSKCDSCGHVLNAADLIPVLSYLFLRGKCRYCGEKIPANGFVAELVWSCCGLVIAVCVLLFYFRSVFS